MDLDGDDEEPPNKSGTCSDSQTSEPLLLLHQGSSSSHDQQPSRKDQLQVRILVMKTVSIAISVVHRVRTLEVTCSFQISTF